MNRDRDSIIGVLYAIGAASLWGILPLYWKMLLAVPALEIMMHRIFWSFIFTLLLLNIKKNTRPSLKRLLNRHTMIRLGISSVLISSNWFIYIWAVNSNHVVEASLGYFINPLFSVLLGVVFLKEKLSGQRLFALLLAAAGVVVVTAHYGKIPWIALSLALTFGLYGLSKKLSPLDSITGLAAETGFVAVPALAYILFKAGTGTGAFGTSSVYVTLLLAGAGVVTALPLIGFAEGTKRVNLSTVGFTQYLSPSLSLLLGVAVFKEPFTATDAVSFSLIWLGLIFYAFSQTSIKTKKELQAAG